MTKLRVLDLFSGIGGFSLGLERSGGFETVAFCEIEDYPRRVLAKHWPGVPIYHDVRELTADTLRRDGIAVDVICGGFPCQDLSFAGKRAGLSGERSGLWGEYRRLIGELRPRFVIAENVPGILSLGLGDVLRDLAALGYDACWECIPASAVGAPHRRDRWWLVACPGSEQHKGDCAAQRGQATTQFHSADATGERCGEAGQLRRHEPKERVGGLGEVMANAASTGREGHQSILGLLESEAVASAKHGNPFAGAWRALGGGFASLRPGNGVSLALERRKLKATGNAVVPQIPELIGHAILRSGVAE